MLVADSSLVPSLSISMVPDELPIVFVRNLPVKSDAKSLFSHFGQAGEVLQIRRGVSAKTRGTAFVVFRSPGEAQSAVSLLDGQQWCGRFLSVRVHSSM